MKQVENIGLNNVSVVGWLDINGCKSIQMRENMGGENLTGRFEDWMYKHCRMKKTNDLLL